MNWVWVVLSQSLKEEGNHSMETVFSCILYCWHHTWTSDSSFFNLKMLSQYHQLSRKFLGLWSHTAVASFGPSCSEASSSFHWETASLSCATDKWCADSHCENTSLWVSKKIFCWFGFSREPWIIHVSLSSHNKFWHETLETQMMF